MEKYIIRGINVNTHIVIDINDVNDTISAVTSTGLQAVKKLSHNKEYVLKVNKTTISTCNVDMLVWLLNNDENVFLKVYTDIAVNDVADIISYKVTKAAFYTLFDNDRDALVTFFNGASHKTKQLVIFDHCCINHNAKMSGMISFSTYVRMNIYCLARS